MANDLTASSVQRQNILNNPFAVTEIQKATSLRGGGDSRAKLGS